MSNDKESSSAGETPNGPLLGSAALGVSVEQGRLLARNAITRRRQAIVYTLARKFLATLDGVTGIAEGAPSEGLTGWVRIESLSQLRAVVGGRFQNLKQKWVGAGFPLREHRGDRLAKAEINSNGWIELSVWINRQGFETKLAALTDPWLFEVKKL